MSWSREAAEIVDVLRTLPGVDDVRAARLATSSDALHAAAAWFAPDERIVTRRTARATARRSTSWPA